jgi:hypothetical protein
MRPRRGFDPHTHRGDGYCLDARKNVSGSFLYKGTSSPCDE